MTSLLDEKQLATIRGFINQSSEMEGINMCQHCFLSELPVIFGLVTVIWIVGTIGLLNR